MCIYFVFGTLCLRRTRYRTCDPGRRVTNPHRHGRIPPKLFNANQIAGIQNKFVYKPLNRDTVIVIGNPQFTMFNFTTGQLKTTESVQLSLYRRNATPLGNCRSAVNPSGDVCWTEIAEQWVYGQPVLGN